MEVRTQEIIFGSLEPIVGASLEEKLAAVDGGVATSTNKFKSVQSITFKDGNDDSASNASTAGTVKAGILANDITEVIKGSDSGMATSTLIFHKVSSITASGDTAGEVEAGVIDGTNEGSDITFTITRTNSGSDMIAASIFVDTSDSTAKDTDYDPKDKFKVSFAAYETQKTFTVSTKSDSVVDDNEFFWANFYINEATTTAFANSKAYINDVDVPTAHTYTITNDSSSGSAVTEGGIVTFTIKRETDQGEEEASTIYLSTSNGSSAGQLNATDDEDIVGLDKLKVDFGKKDNIKTVTVNTKTDTIGDEGEENFYLLLSNPWVMLNQGIIINIIRLL